MARFNQPSGFALIVFSGGDSPMAMQAKLLKATGTASDDLPA
jgi:hypothetical protein